MSADQERLRRRWAALRERWWLVIIPMVIGAALAGGLAASQSKIYEAKTNLLFQETSFDQLLFGRQVFAEPPSTPTAAITTNIKLLSQPQIAELASRRQHLGLTADQLQQKVSVTQQGDSNLVTLAVRDHNARRAARIANAWAASFLAFQREAKRQPLLAGVRSLQQRLAALPNTRDGAVQRASLLTRLSDLKTLSQVQTAQAQVTQYAKVPHDPVSPRPIRDAIVGGIVGLLLGSVLSLLIGWLDRRIKRVEDAEALYGQPVLAAIPPRGRSDNRQGVTWLADDEGFRTLRSTLPFFELEQDNALKTLMITSAEAADGKTTVTAGLAFALASAGKRVVCVDADLRRPQLAIRLGQPVPGSGLMNVLLGDMPVDHALVDVPLPLHGRSGPVPGGGSGRLQLLHTGPLPPNPAEIVASDELRRLLNQLAATEGIDMVLIDTPPLLAVGDAVSLARTADATLVAVRISHSTTDAATNAAGMLRRTDVHVLGVVALGVRLSRASYDYYAGSATSPNGSPTGSIASRSSAQDEEELAKQS
jgi:capsular exopolysaccharide synthesis family protein